MFFRNIMRLSSSLLDKNEYCAFNTQTSSYEIQIFRIRKTVNLGKEQKTILLIIFKKDKFSL